ncbi:MAG: class I SAM-dependent methyltransferase [Nitrospirae bacterium]|nr:class I SAM-dependent methyltransferase [Nitrospirota bacterium]
MQEEYSGGVNRALDFFKKGSCILKFSGRQSGILSVLLLRQKIVDNISDAVRAFDLYAEDYDRWFESPEGKALFDSEVKAVSILISGLKPPFLEVGVGSGRFAEALGAEYGVDPSPALLEKAKARGVKVKLGRGEDLPYKDNSFGGVFILFSLCFLDDPEKALCEAKRVLKPGGGLIIGIINRESTWGLLYSRKKAEGHQLYRYARLYSPAEVIDMIKKIDMIAVGFSSTLLRRPSENHEGETVQNRLLDGAGFICIIARKQA